MIFKRYVKNPVMGISIGLEYPYRAKKIGKRYVIYRMSDGKIIEKLHYNKINSINESNAIKRLYKINNLEMKVSENIKSELDSEN